VIAGLLLAAALANAGVGPPHGYLVIHGGGGGVLCQEETAPDACEDHLDEFARLAGGVRASIVIIPTAALFEDAPPPSIPLSWSSRPQTYDDAFRERYASIFRRRGVESIRFLHTTSRQEADSDVFAAPLRNATGVWFVGGRQWILADTYLDTKTELALHDLLDRGGVIGGGSAAAAIQASYLVRGDSRGNVPVVGDRERGFGFLRNSAIDIHVLSWNRQFDLLRVVESHPELLGIGIDADASIVVHGDEFRVIGVGYVAVYDARLLVPERRFYFVERGERFDLATRTPLTASGRPRSIAGFTSPYVPRPGMLETAAGRYSSDGRLIEVRYENDGLTARLAPDDERALVPVAPDVFVDAILNNRVTFQRNSHGRATGFVWEWPRCTMSAARVD
jgi:cyanophycinase